MCHSYKIFIIAFFVDWILCSFTCFTLQADRLYALVFLKNYSGKKVQCVLIYAELVLLTCFLFIGTCCSSSIYFPLRRQSTNSLRQDLSVFCIIPNYKNKVFMQEWKAHRSVILYFCLITSLITVYISLEISGFAKQNTPELLGSTNETSAFCSVCLYLMVLNFMLIKTCTHYIAFKFYWLKEVCPKLFTVKVTNYWRFCCDISFPFVQRVMRYHWKTSLTYLSGSIPDNLHKL